MTTILVGDHALSDRLLVPLFTGFDAAERFTPDLYLVDGDDLAQHGLEATILSLPGHSRGSVGVLTAAGELFCGDLFENTKGPVLNSLMDDPSAAAASLARLESLKSGRSIPGTVSLSRWNCSRMAHPRQPDSSP
jgi:hydroxyacylglutathione hydrolase